MSSKFWSKGPLFWLAATASFGLPMLTIDLGRATYGPPPDIRLFYTGSDTLAYLASLPTEIAHRYFWHEILDLGFMTAYTGLQVSLWASLTRANSVPWNLAAHLWPWMGGAFDSVETVGILALMALPGLPGREPLASIIATATPIKYFFLATSSAWIGWRSFRSSREANRPQSPAS